MGGRVPTSVILATVRWTPVIDELGEQLQGDDELLVVCDAADDPVANREGDLPDGARLLVAGEPEGCTGKANAIATGLEAAQHDRIAWTDDDFHHPPDWLAQLHADYEAHGPVSELPFFVGTDPLSVLLEPQYSTSNVMGLYAEDKPWGGAVIFERDDLDLEAYVADLRRTVSDDGLLSEYLEVTNVRRTRRVEIGGSIRKTLERHVRFTQIVFRHQTTAQGAVYALLTFAIAAVVAWFPLWGFVATTAVTAGMYAFFGVRRWTFLLAYPVTVLGPVFLVYALGRRTFVWGGRRYRWPSKFEVEVVG